MHICDLELGRAMEEDRTVLGTEELDMQERDKP